MSATDPTDESIGLAIRQFRLKANLSQHQLCRLMPGWHVTTATKVEHGFRGVKAIEILPLSRALQVSPAELIDGMKVRAAIASEVGLIKGKITALDAARQRLLAVLDLDARTADFTPPSQLSEDQAALWLSRRSQ